MSFTGRADLRRCADPKSSKRLHDGAPNLALSHKGMPFSTTQILGPADRAGKACAGAPKGYRSSTGLPPCSLLRCAASMNAKISSVSWFETGG